MKWLPLVLLCACSRDAVLGNIVPPTQDTEEAAPASGVDSVAPTGSPGPTGPSAETGPTGASCTPGPAEICGDGVDNDCNGFFDEQEPSGSCDVFLLHVLSPVNVLSSVPHKLSVTIDVQIFPADTSFGSASPLARSWSVIAASGGAMCDASDLIEDGGAMDTADRYLRVVKLAAPDDPLVMGCAYNIEVSIGPRSTRRFTVVFENRGLASFSLYPAAALGAGYEVWVSAQTGGLLVLNASDQDGDVPYTFRLIDTSGITACAPSCQVVDATNATFPIAGPITAGDYMLRVQVLDAASVDPQIDVNVIVHVVHCAWAASGGLGAQDGTSPLNAAASIASTLVTSNNVCLIGSDTFSEDVVLGSAVLLGGFDAAGAPSLFDRPTIALQSSPLTIASGASAVIRTANILPAATTALITAVDASLLLDDVWLRVPSAPSANGVAFTAMTQSSSLTLSRSAVRFLSSGNAATVLAINAQGAAASLTIDRTVFEISPCAHACSIVQTSGPASVNVSRMGLEFSADDATVFSIASGVPSLDIQSNSGWLVSGTSFARIINAPSGANALLRNNTITTMSSGSAIALSFGVTGAVTVEGNSITARADSAEAIVVDLAATSGVSLTRNTLTASAAYSGSTTALRAAAIRLSQTANTQIVGNRSLKVEQSGAQYGIGILDGTIDRQGVRTAGASTDLLIENNARIIGGNGNEGSTPQDCSMGVPQTTDIAAGVVLVGSVRPIVRGNGRPREKDSGICGGRTRPYWNASTRRLPPIVAGVWLVETQDPIIEDNELRGGDVVALSDMACVPVSEPPPTLGLLDGLVTSGASAAEGGSTGLRARRNGIDCAAAADGILREPSHCEAVVLAASANAILENNFIGASEGAALVTVRAQGGDLSLLHNFLSLQVVTDGASAPTGRSYDKRAIVNESGASLTVVGNVFAVANDGADSLVLFSGATQLLWGNLIDSALALDAGSVAGLAAGTHNLQGHARYLDFASVWQRSLARMPATSDGLNLAPRAAVFSSSDIDGQSRDLLPDAGPDELVR